MRTIALATLTLAVAVTPLVAQNRRTPPTRSQRIEERTLERQRADAEELARRLSQYGLTAAERARLEDLTARLQSRTLSQSERAQLAEALQQALAHAQAAQQHALSAAQRAQIAELAHAAQQHALSDAQRTQIAELAHAAQQHALSDVQRAQIAEMAHAAQQHALSDAQRAQIAEMAHAAQQHALTDARQAQIEELAHAARENAGTEHHADFTRQLDRFYGDGPRVPQARQQDPADSVYRAARDRLSRNDFAEAARLFGRIRQESRFARSGLRAEAFYWEAFALGRMGTEDALRRAQESLGQLLREYTATQRPRDTNGLLATINAQLAQLGSAADATRVRTMFDEARWASEATREALTQAQVAQWNELAIARGVELAMPFSQRNAQCVNDEAEIRLIALGALVRMDTAAAMPVLRDVMARRDECAAALRGRALIIINRIRSPEAENILFDAARNDPDAGVRQSALVWLSSRSPDRAISIGEDALRTAQDAETREWALQSLAKTRNERAWRAIRDFAMRNDVSLDDRRAAIVALGGTADSTNVAYLRDLYSRVGERQLREAILMSTALRRSSADADWLMTIAQTEGEDMRLREIAINRIRGNREITLDRWISLYDRVAEKRIKQATLDVIASRARSEPAAIEKLIGVARTESDIDLRKKAVLSLADINDPRARELMIEIINRRL